MGHTAAFQDIDGTWRHKKCLLLLSTLKICKFCINVKNSLKRKHYRVQMMKKLKRIKFPISTCNQQYQQKLILLQKRYYRAEKARKRAKYTIERLKIEITECMAKIKNISEETIEDQLKKRNISKNQICAALKIIKAAKYSNLKNRRYNEH